MHTHTHTSKAVGSRHLCFKFQRSYYGFHFACKALSICFWLVFIWHALLPCLISKCLEFIPSEHDSHNTHLLFVVVWCLIILATLILKQKTKINYPLKVHDILKDLYHGAPLSITTWNKLITAVSIFTNVWTVLLMPISLLLSSATLLS